MPQKAFPGIGLWKLISYEVKDDVGSVTNTVRKDANGQIGYDANGNMWVQIADLHRTNFTINDRYKGTPTEIKAAIEGYAAYYGTYDFDESKEAVTHHITSCLYPNWDGTSQLRYCEFFGDQMLLRTPRLRMGGKDVVATLVWERMA